MLNLVTTHYKAITEHFDININPNPLRERMKHVPYRMLSLANKV